MGEGVDGDEGSCGGRGVEEEVGGGEDGEDEPDKSNLRIRPLADDFALDDVECRRIGDCAVGFSVTGEGGTANEPGTSPSGTETGPTSFR